MSKYVVCWESRKTGARGNGKGCDSRTTAVAWAIEENAKYPELKHWVVDSSTGKPVFA
jgi:hypothetical protein